MWFASFVFIVNISAEDEKRLFNGTVDWIVSCQTYEGGIGGVPDKEAHGGYTFCGIAALALLGSTGKCNLQKLLVCVGIAILSLLFLRNRGVIGQFCFIVL